MARLAEMTGRPRVLIVDDHAAMLAYVGQLLAREFIIVGLVADAETLMTEWDAARADVIVLDIGLPGCSGFEAAARLRVAGCDVPIVFCSVHEEAEFVRAGWAAGALGYVAKRDLGWDLAPAIRAALRGRRFRSRAVEAA
jgi:DNA-binding NarL/FixJ family response regulator